MQFSAAGMELLKRSEGFRARIYLDHNGYPTIGYGHKMQQADSWPHGIDESMAEHILSCDVADAATEIEHLVKVPLTQGQFDALVDFVFNLGAGRLEHSTLLGLLNLGQYDEAGQQILRWDHVGGVDSAALKTRREAELALWNGV